jgi:hypothetical protein
MRPYIVNLTNNLIGKHDYDRLSKRMDRLNFFEHVKDGLEVHDVEEMTPETLGRILCSLEIGDVMASKAEMLNGLHFSGDCEDMLRGLVATCLAYAIAGRLESDDTRMNDIPAYRRTKEARIGSRK